MVSSTVPRFDDRCPPVCATECSRNVAQLAREVAQFACVEQAQVGGAVDAFEQRIHGPWWQRGQCVRCVIQSAISCSRRAAPPKRASARMRFLAQRCGMPFRFGEPEHADVRRLVLRGVLAGGLAERGAPILRRRARRRRPGTRGPPHRRTYRARVSSPGTSGRPQAAPRRIAARISAPVFIRCIVSSSGSDIATPTCARSIAWPPAMPGAPRCVREQRASLPRHRAAGSTRAWRTHAPAARRPRAARGLRRTRHGTSACRGAARRRPCTAGRRAPANTRESFPRRPRDRRPLQDRHRPIRRQRRRSSGRTRLPPPSTA